MKHNIPVWHLTHIGIRFFCANLHRIISLTRQLIPVHLNANLAPFFTNICSLALKHMFIGPQTYVRSPLNICPFVFYGGWKNFTWGFDSIVCCIINLGWLCFTTTEGTPVDKNISGIFPAFVYLLTFSPLIVQCPPNTSSIVRILSWLLEGCNRTLSCILSGESRYATTLSQLGKRSDPKCIHSPSNSQVPFFPRSSMR